MSHGASPRKVRAVDVDRIWQLYLTGLSAAVIVVRLGVSRRSVNAAIQRRREAEAANGRASA